MIVTDKERIGPWVCERTGGTYEPTTAAAIGWESEGELVAGVLYDQYNGRSICMHVAAEKPVTRTFTKTAFDYPFNQLGVQKVIGLVDSTNDAALRFDRKLGFVEEARIKDAGKHGDLILLTMTKERCRWLTQEPEVLVVSDSCQSRTCELDHG